MSGVPPFTPLRCVNGRSPRGIEVTGGALDAYVAPHEALARFARTKGGVAASRIVTLGMPLRRHLPA